MATAVIEASGLTANLLALICVEVLDRVNVASDGLDVITILNEIVAGKHLDAIAVITLCTLGHVIDYGPDCTFESKNSDTLLIGVALLVVADSVDKSNVKVTAVHI